MRTHPLVILAAAGIVFACAGGEQQASTDLDSMRRELARYAEGAVQDSAAALSALDSVTVVVVTDSVGVSSGWRLMWSSQEFGEIGSSMRSAVEAALTDAGIRVVSRAPDTLRLNVQNGTSSSAGQSSASVWSMQLALRRPMALVASADVVTMQSVWYLNHVDVGVGPSYQSPAAAREATARVLDGWMAQLSTDLGGVRPDSADRATPSDTGR
jgi:hypothetical protein